MFVKAIFNPALSRSAFNCSQRVSLRGPHRRSLLAVRCQSTSTSPLPTDNTSKSEGLYPQVHPSGRPPLNPKSAKPIQDEIPIEGVSTPATPGYRTPLRTTSSNIPVRLEDGIEVVYDGPFRVAVRRLKAFSISSLLLSGAMTPVILAVDAPIPHAARLGIIVAGSLLLFSNSCAVISVMLIYSSGGQCPIYRPNSLFTYTLRRTSEILSIHASTESSNIQSLCANQR